MQRRCAKSASEAADEDAVGEGEENELHQAIIAELRRLLVLHIHSRTDRPTTQANGIPDFVLFPDHKPVIFIECKTRVGKLSTEQKAFQFMAELAGYRFEVVRSMSRFMEIEKDL